jgi:hypothetical protein
VLSLWRFKPCYDLFRQIKINEGLYGMSSSWEWFDDSKTISLVSIQGDWSRDDLAAYTSEFWPQMSQQPHTVHIVVDLRQSGLLPLQPIVSLVWLATHRPRNAGRVIFVVKRALGLALARALNSTIQKLHPEFHITGVLTLEEAIQLLTPVQMRIDETVEVPASSLAEAGSQSPSVSPR